MPAPYSIDIPAFRVSYPQFSNETIYPDVMISNTFTTATCYIENSDYGYLSGDCRYTALTLMTAHLLLLNTWINAGQVPGLVQQAQVDLVRVSLTAAPIKTQWQWWLSLTGYGQQLLALLQAAAVGGMYIGGLPEGSAFRKVAGIFL